MAPAKLTRERKEEEGRDDEELGNDRIVG